MILGALGWAKAPQGMWVPAEGQQSAGCGRWGKGSHCRPQAGQSSGAGVARCSVVAEEGEASGAHGGLCVGRHRGL